MQEGAGGQGTIAEFRAGDQGIRNKYTLPMSPGVSGVDPVWLAQFSAQRAARIRRIACCSFAERTRL